MAAENRSVPVFPGIPRLGTSFHGKGMGMGGVEGFRPILGLWSGSFVDLGTGEGIERDPGHPPEGRLGHTSEVRKADVSRRVDSPG